MLHLRLARTILQRQASSSSAIPCRPWQLSRPHSRRHVSGSPIKLVERRGSDADDDQLEVNYFEQGDGPTPKRRRVLPDDELEDVASLKARIASLEKEIQDFKLPQEIPESIAGKLFSRRQREQSTQNFETDLAELGIGEHQIEFGGALSRTGQIYLDKLNECLDTASVNPEDETSRKALWKWYERSKSNIPRLLAIVPKAGWDLLWQSQAIKGPSNPDRESHLATLADDMLAAGLILSKEQQYLHIEASYLTGQVEKALQLWESCSIPDTTTSEYLEMGVRMFAQQGNVEKMEELLRLLFSSTETWDPRVLHTAITAYTQRKSKPHLQRAWELYLRLREALAEQMTVTDYDTITLNFLRADSRDLALAVFRDMMLSGDAQAAKDSTPVYKKALTRMGQFFSLTKDAEEVNAVSLDALTYLPLRYQNKFFYASWLKRLIGMGQLDAAAQVIELMYERGVAPDAKHMNGLVSAWLREGGSEARRQAESLAWSMIQRRIDFVHARRHRKDPNSNHFKSSVYVSRPDLKLPAFLDRPVPFATSETFSIMVAHYLRQEMFENVRHLRDMIADCEIPMSSYFMNHLLYAELRNRGYRHVWARFQVMTRTVKPDVETFICLWECMKFHMDKTKNSDTTGFPTPEQLFSVMIQWVSGLRGQERSDAIGDLDLDTYHDIIRCFCRMGSYEGAFVVMHAIKESFQLYPTMKTVRMLVMQLARMNMPSQRRPSPAKSLKHKAQQEQNLAKITELLDIISSQRRQQMKEQGVEFTDLGEVEQREELHRSLLSLLHTMASRQHGSGMTDESIRAMSTALSVTPFNPQDDIALLV